MAHLLATTETSMNSPRTINQPGPLDAMVMASFCMAGIWSNTHSRSANAAIAPARCA